MTSINSTREEIDKTLVYFTSQRINMPSKTRESVYTVFRSKIDIFSSSFIGKILFSDISSENSSYFQIKNTKNGKIIILDTPVSAEKEEGRIFQEIVKSIWQNEMIANPADLPCILVSDEFQQFAFESDVEFLSINRSYNLGMILATQNYTSLVDKLGEIKTKRLLGNIQTKFFFQTSDKNTWQFARELMGEVDSNSFTQQYNQSLSSSISSSQKYELLGEHFQQLGMNLKPSQAEAIVFKKGYLFKDNNKKYLKVVFNKVDEIKDDVDDEFRAKSSLNNAEYFDVKKVVGDILKSGKISNEKDIDSNVQEATAKLQSIDEYLTVNEVITKYPIGRTKLFSIIEKEKIPTKKGVSKGGVPPTLVSRVELERVLEV